MLLQGFIQFGLKNLQEWRLQTPSSSAAGVSAWWKCSLQEVWVSLFSTYCLSSSQYTWLWGAWPHLFSTLTVDPGSLLSGPLKPSVLCVEQAQLPQPLLTRQMFQPRLSWWSSAQLAAGYQCFNCSGGPKLDAVLHMWSNIVQSKGG